MIGIVLFANTHTHTQHSRFIPSDPFAKLLIIRCLRPDRLTAALELFIASNMGPTFVKDPTVDLASSLKDSTPTTPIFFILSPGVNPLAEVEALGAKLGYSEEAGRFHAVSLGQGQETVAEQALNNGFKSGHWVFLSNIHLTQKWYALEWSHSL